MVLREFGMNKNNNNKIKKRSKRESGKSPGNSSLIEINSQP
jgi:hypothetical protein